MSRMRLLILVVSVVLFFVLGRAEPEPVLAQGAETCPTVISDLVAATGAACEGIAAGGVCVPTDAVQVSWLDSSLAGAGPVVALQNIDSVASIRLDPLANTWGLSLLDVPGLGTGERIRGVLFGEAQLFNAPGPPLMPVCNAVSIGTVNIRAEPNTSAAVLGVLELDGVLPITARLPDSSWWQILYDGEPAWVFAQLAPADCNPAEMLVLDPVTGEVSGGLPAPNFQRVRLESSFEAPACADAPRGGLLVQPVGESASWVVNGVEFGFNGTLLLQAGTDDVLLVQVLAGRAIAEIGGVSRVVDAGQLLRVPLRGGILARVPGPPLEMLSADAVNAPLALLPRAVAVEGRPLVSLPASSAGADLVCDVLPQAVRATAGTPVTIQAGAETTMRISGVGDVSRLEWQSPVGERQVFEAEGNNLPLVDIVAQEAGLYTVVAQGTGAVVLTATCGLPAQAAVPQLQTCEDVLLAWDGISGNSVRFAAPLGAAISVIAAHELPSLGAASVLELLNDAGDRLVQAPFVSVGGVQSAGPLEWIATQDGTFRVRWDGDPFNVTRVEVLCLPPQTMPAPAEAPTS